MRNSPRKIAGATDLYNRAISALARRAYSVHEMKLYLERRAENKEIAAGILGILKDRKVLDDERYARQFVRLHAEIRKQGAFRITRDLRARGVPDVHIQAALGERGEGSSEDDLLRTQLQKRLKLLRGPIDQRRTASIYRSMLRAGFAAQSIQRELRRMAPGNAGAEALPEVSEGLE